MVSSALAWVKDWTPTLQIITNALLTGALVYLYYRQNQIQREQSETQQEQTEIQSQQSSIMENQEKLLELEYKPRVLVNKWDIEGDEIYVNLSNTGGGEALELKIILSLLPKNELYYPNGVERDEHEISLHSRDSPINSQYSKVIEGDEFEKFKTQKGNFAPKGNSRHNVNTSEFYEIIQDIELEYVEINLAIEYKDVLGEKHRNDFSRLSTDISISTNGSFEELVSEDSELMHFPESIEPRMHYDRDEK